MEKQPHYPHLKYKGLFQPYSWPFCSSIIRVDTADKFIYLNSTLPSSAVIADKYLCFQNKLNTRFSAKSCLEQSQDHSPWICVWRVWFYFCSPSWSSAELPSLTVKPVPPVLPAHESGNLLTRLCKKHWTSISQQDLTLYWNFPKTL